MGVKVMGRAGFEVERVGDVALNGGEALAEIGHLFTLNQLLLRRAFDRLDVGVNAVYAGELLQQLGRAPLVADALDARGCYPMYRPSRP